MARTPLGASIMLETERIRAGLHDASVLLTGLEALPIQEALRGLERIDHLCARMLPIPKRVKDDEAGASAASDKPASVPSGGPRKRASRAPKAAS